MERMLQSATYGVQMLENAIMQAKASETRPPVSQVEAEETPKSDNATSSTKKSVSRKNRMMHVLCCLIFFRRLQRMMTLFKKDKPV
jgi:hypothetical protein